MKENKDENASPSNKEHIANLNEVEAELKEVEHDIAEVNKENQSTITHQIINPNESYHEKQLAEKIELEVALKNDDDIILSAFTKEEQETNKNEIEFIKKFRATKIKSMMREKSEINNQVEYAFLNKANEAIQQDNKLNDQNNNKQNAQYTLLDLVENLVKRKLRAFDGPLNAERDQDYNKTTAERENDKGIMTLASILTDIALIQKNYDKTVNYTPNNNELDFNKYAVLKKPEEVKDNMEKKVDESKGALAYIYAVTEKRNEIQKLYDQLSNSTDKAKKINQSNAIEDFNAFTKTEQIDETKSIDEKIKDFIEDFNVFAKIEPMYTMLLSKKIMSHLLEKIKKKNDELESVSGMDEKIKTDEVAEWRLKEVYNQASMLYDLNKKFDSLVYAKYTPFLDKKKNVSVIERGNNNKQEDTELEATIKQIDESTKEPFAMRVAFNMDVQKLYHTIDSYKQASPSMQKKIAEGVEKLLLSKIKNVSSATINLIKTIMTAILKAVDRHIVVAIDYTKDVAQNIMQKTEGIAQSIARKTQGIPQKINKKTIDFVNKISNRGNKDHYLGS